MKRIGLSAALAVACFQGLFLLAGCGGGSGGGGTTPPPNNPYITTFSLNVAAIEVGSSTTLTAVFGNGTGVVTAAGGFNQSVTSGTAIPVNPTTTTTYTLTVTGASGTTAATSTATLTVDPVPTISAFTAGAAEIEAGSSTTLTASFTGGTAMITPGNLAITSGGNVTVNPTTTTTYTLTVAPPVGSINATSTTTVTVVPVPTITSFTGPATTTSSSSISLNAVFANGTGSITGTGIATPVAVASGTPVSVTAPTTATQITATYTLTVAPPVGTVNATSNVTVTVNPGPTITSFSANPTQVESGSSTSLIGVFTGGTGMITGPGGFSANATSGTSVPVIPPTATAQTTDTYTLTVTPSGGGTAATQTTNVTVYPAPSITSFSASPNPMVAGGSGAQLTAVFSGGTGVVTPGANGTSGSINVTSGTAVTVNPTLTTTYTLTVTPTIGAAATQTTSITVYPSVTVCTTPSCSGPAISSLLRGMNLAMWWDDVANASYVLSAFQKAGITAVRWPGGSNSDIYHWNGSATYPTIAAATDCQGGYSVPDDTFANFETDIVQAGSLDLAVTADYGSNAACTGGGDPNEAAGWAAASVADGHAINYMTVGNENYGSWEYDLHSPAANQHNPTVYASEMVGSSGFYKLIKNASPSTLVGVVVDANSSCCAANWDSTVLGNAKGSYDFVEYHYYPQNPGGENDTYLVQKAAQDFTTNINTLKGELSTAGAPNTPIYVGEIGSVSSNPGVQTWSITQGLYAGQVLGEAMNDGVARLTWWIGFGNCNGNSGNMSASLYGWQTFGAYNVFADQADSGGSPAKPCDYSGGSIGTMSPTAEAFNLFQNVGVNGEFPQTTTVAGDTTNVRAYAATHGSGYALMLFNLSETATETVSVNIGSKSSSADVQVITYDKALYDQTSGPTPAWAAPTTTDLGAQTLPLTVTLQPWSMNVVIVK